MTNINDTCQDIQYVLEDSLPDAYNGTRTGSMVFDSNIEINFNKYMPKLQVFPEQVSTDNLSFGTAGRLRDNVHRINVVFLTKQGEVGSGTGGLKDRQLVHHYMHLIENAILHNAGSIRGCTILGFGGVDDVPFDATNATYIGIKPVVLLMRQ